MRRFATNAANSYARADVRETLKKRKEKEKGKEKEREEKKQKIPHSEVVQNVSFFDYIYRCINFISVFKNRFEIRILKVLAAKKRRRGEKMEEEEKCMCVCEKGELRHLLRDGN